MTLRLRSSPRSSFGRNPVRPRQLALEQVSSMLTPLRNAHAWLQERTAPPSVEDQLHESGLVIESDESIQDEQNLDESSNRSHGSQQSSEPPLRNVTIRTRERKHSPTQGEPTSSTKDESGKQKKPPSHDERGIRSTRGGRGTGRPTPGGGGMGGRGRISLGHRGGGRSSSGVGKMATLHSADGSAVGDGHTPDRTKPLPKKVEKESRTNKTGKKSERRPESKKKSEKQRAPSPTSTLSGSSSGRTPSPPKRRNSGPDPPGGGGGGSDGSNHNEEVRHEGDAVWLQLPRRLKPSGNKKVLPHKELQALAKDMFDEAGSGVPLHEHFLQRVHEVSTNNLRECLSLLDLESNVQHYLQRQGFVPRPAFSGLDSGETYVK